MAGPNPWPKRPYPTATVAPPSERRVAVTTAIGPPRGHPSGSSWEEAGDPSTLSLEISADA
ncbi:hypothetical protein ACHAWF_005966 [Thalassiosira exigua]